MPQDDDIASQIVLNEDGSFLYPCEGKCGRMVKRKKIFSGKLILCNACKLKLFGKNQKGARLKKEQIKQEKNLNDEQYQNRQNLIAILAGLIDALKEKRMRFCPICGREINRKHMSSKQMVCNNCYQAMRRKQGIARKKKECGFCHEIKEIFGNIDGIPICHNCLRKRKRREKKGERRCKCGKVLGIRNRTGLCYDCRIKERNDKIHQKQKIARREENPEKYKPRFCKCGKEIGVKNKSGLCGRCLTDLYFARKRIMAIVFRTLTIDQLIALINQEVYMGLRPRVTRQIKKSVAKTRPEEKLKVVSITPSFKVKDPISTIKQSDNNVVPIIPKEKVETKHKEVVEDGCRIGRMTRCPKCKTIDFLDYISKETGESICHSCYDLEIRRIVEKNSKTDDKKIVFQEDNYSYSSEIKKD